MPQERHAYTDESGNTGLNLFDENQPTFWTGTLISYADVDTRYLRYHRELLRLAGVDELHAAQMGMVGLEKIAKQILQLMREKKLHLLFSRVDKKHLAATKMFDLVFDSGNNLAMPTHGYAVQQLRLITAMHFVQMLTEEDLREFWDLFKKQDAPRFGVLLTTLLQRVNDYGFDARSTQIIQDVLRWGSEHPEDILDPFSERDSPNFVAFTMLFDYLHDLHLDHGHLVATFVHDEQNQFMKAFRQTYELVSRFRHDTGPMTLISDIHAIDSFTGDLVVKSSAESFGLQLVDVCLWLLKRVLDRREPVTGACAQLFRWIVESNYLVRFDFEKLVRQVQNGADYVNNLPLTEEQLARGKTLVSDFESRRQKRMARLPE